MKRTILLLLTLSLLLCLCACAEKKTKKSAESASREDPTEIVLTIGAGENTETSPAPNSDRIPIGEIQESKPRGDLEAQTLPTLSWTEIPEPEPVEPDTEVAES